MIDEPDDTGAKHDGRDESGRWAQGASGNPSGRPLGSRSSTTLALEQLLDGEAETITRVCIERAKDGDHHAMKLVIDRILPMRRGRPVHFELPEIEGASDLTRAHGAVLKACAAGTLTPEEGAQIAGVLDAVRRSIETTDLEQRLAVLEQAKGITT